MNKIPTYPEIKESVFGDPKNIEFTKGDAKLNAALLDAADTVVKPKVCYERADGGLLVARFYTDCNWMVRIEDRHHIEKDPHYVLEFGYGLEGRFEKWEKILEEDYDNLGLAKLRIRVDYCDNLSVLETRTIEQDPGYFLIKVIGDMDLLVLMSLIQVLKDTYEEKLKEIFQEYDIKRSDRYGEPRFSEEAIKDFSEKRFFSMKPYEHEDD